MKLITVLPQEMAGDASHHSDDSVWWIKQQQQQHECGCECQVAGGGAGGGGGMRDALSLPHLSSPQMFRHIAPQYYSQVTVARAPQL